MSKELFANNIAENLSLAQAIVRNILPMPKYVCSLYSLKEEVENLKDRVIKARIAKTTKKKFLEDIDTASIRWDQCNGVSAILKKHLRKSMRKFIVFCADQEHLLKMEKIVSDWFTIATDGEPIKTYRISDNEPRRFENLQAFKDADYKKAIHLLFSVNMLNEGLHVNEVSGVVLLRPTESPNIFYQQIGRCLKVGMNHTPVIFDLVNNFKSIHSKEFLYDLDFARLQYAAERGAQDLKDIAPTLTLMDEVREITEVFGQIRFRINEWEHFYERLVEYKERFGTCEVKGGKDPEFQSLQGWLYNQRVKYANAKLDPERKEKLIALGVDLANYQPLGAKEDRWQERFEELCAFRKQFGHCNVGDPHKDHKELRAFVAKQRSRYKTGVLEQYRIDKLLSIGFEFERNYVEGLWQKHFDELVAHKNEYGHLHVDYKTHYLLSRWVELQKRIFRKGKMDAMRQQKLLSIGFEFTEGRDNLFESRMSKLIAWYHEHHHFNFQSGSELNQFVYRLRVNYRRNYLSTDTILRLQAIGFDFAVQQRNDDVKEIRLKQLAEFVKLNGHCEVNQKNEMFEGLSAWLTDQRKHHRQNNLTPQHTKKLEALGMIWSYKKKWREDSWSSKYEQLFSIYKKTGSTLLSFGEDEKLSGWCTHQRKYFKLGKLSKERIEKLEAINFSWNVAETEWSENYAALLCYKDQHGHCRVSESKNRKLHIWCSNVKKSLKEGRLAEERKKQLDAIGFVWDVFEAMWQAQYETLKIFLKENSWKDLNRKNMGLTGWVSQQRAFFKNGELSEEKAMLLNMLGIDWNPVNSGRNERFEGMLNDFLQYKQAHGTAYVSYSDKKHRALWAWCYKLRKRYQDNKLSASELQLLNDAGFKWK